MKQILIVFLTLSMAIVSAGASAEQKAEQHKGFTEVWNFQTKGPAYGGASITNNILFTGSDDKNFYAISAEEGDLIWSFSTQGPIRSTPVPVGETIVFFSDDGNVYCLNQSNGQELWKYSIGPKIDNRSKWDYVSPSPTSDGEKIYIGYRDKDFFAINANDGSLAWKNENEEGFVSMPVVNKDSVYAGCNDGYVYGFDRQTGKQTFSFNTSFGSAIDTRPLIIEDLMICGGKYPYIYGVDMNTQKELWRIDYHGSWVNSSPIYSDGLVYIGSSDLRCLVCINPDKGEAEWMTFVAGHAWSIPAVSEKYVFQASFSHNRKADLYCIDKKTGEIIATFLEDKMTEAEKRRTQRGNEIGITGGPVVYNDYVYINTVSGSVICLKEKQ